MGRTATERFLDRGFPVRATVRHGDDRAAALRAADAEVVIGELLEPADVWRLVSGWRRVDFGMSVSSDYLEASVTMVAVAQEVGADALVNISQTTVSQMNVPTPPPSPQPRQHWLSEFYESYRAHRCFFPRRCPNGCSSFVVLTQGGG
ncbi:MAG: NAD(P)H-binding protein [Isosphaeraceae bacterium]|nr:NAD(P)H-binding protein [Isosphaeraceae bacterium]